VNDEVHRLTDEHPTLVIRFGAGVSPGPEHAHDESQRWYDPHGRTA
jgi:hypothetical protein